MAYEAVRGDGTSISPHEGIVPILKEIAPGHLKVVGTGFYVTRYGMFVSAGHVLTDLKDDGGTSIVPAYVCHSVGDQVHMRRIQSICVFHEEDKIDVGIGQADHYEKEYPNDPLMNLRAPLSFAVPQPDEKLVTFAYPENGTLDFTGPEPRIVSIRADYYDGRFLEYVERSDNPFVRAPYFQTTIRVLSGASGGPVFNSRGRVIGVNCRSWDFGDPADNLSTIVPIAHISTLQPDWINVPSISAERQSLDQHPRRAKPSIADLIECGHLDLE